MVVGIIRAPVNAAMATPPARQAEYVKKKAIEERWLGEHRKAETKKRARTVPRCLMC